MAFQKGNSNGVTTGKSHKEGGIPMEVKSTGQKIELEGGEGVINKRNMASEKTYEFEGEEKTICEIASDINSADGNGVKIDCDDITGRKYKYNKGGILNEYEEESFIEWFEDGNVIQNQDGTYSTQDAQYRNRLKDINEVKKYFYNEFIKGQYNKGGMVDLFEEYEQQPPNVRAIYDKYQDKIIDGDFDYSDSADFLKEMESIGYTFEYGLDNESYGLRPIDVPLNQLEGYEDFADGGVVPNDSVIANYYGYKAYNLKDYEMDNLRMAYIRDVLEPHKEKKKLDKINREKEVKVRLSDEYDSLLKQYGSADTIAELYDLDLRDGRTDEELKKEWIDYRWKVYPYKYADGGDIKHPFAPDLTKSHREKIMGAYSGNYADGGKLEPTIEELKERERKSQEDFKRLWSGFKRNVAQSFGGTYRPSNEETNNYIEEYNKQKHNVKARRKFEMGGMTYEPHNVFVEFENDFTADIYTMSGQYEGDTLFKRNKMYNMVFLNNKGNSTALQFPNSDLYVMIPNSEFMISGFDSKYADGGSVKPYSKYTLSENDKEAIELLRSDVRDYSVRQLEKLASFKGVNVVNQLSETLINKIYGLMFKNHNIDNPIKKLYIHNVGIGKLLKQSPVFLDEVIVNHSDNLYGNIESEICFITNMTTYNNKKVSDYTNIGLSDVNAIVCCCEHTDPKNDEVINLLDEVKNNAIGVGISEFTSQIKLMEFIEEIQDAVNKSKTKFATINEGITNRGVITLIYTITKI